MDLNRKGENLWSEWVGLGYSKKMYGSVVFYTVGHVDIEHEIVRRGLASAIQRDGIFDTLGQAYKAINDWTSAQGWAGEVDEDPELSICSSEGETRNGDYVDNVFNITWVEVSTFG